MKKTKTLTDHRQLRGRFDEKPSKRDRLVQALLRSKGKHFTAAEIRKQFGISKPGSAVAALRLQGYDINQEFVKDNHGRYMWRYWIDPIDPESLPEELRGLDLYDDWAPTSKDDWEPSIE